MLKEGNVMTANPTPIEGELTDEDLRDVCGGAYLQNGVHIPRPSAAVRSGWRNMSVPDGNQKTIPAIADHAGV